MEGIVFKPTALRVYLLRAIEANYDPDEILAGSGTRWSEIESLKAFDLDTIAGLFDYLARRTEPEFAMRCGQACKIRDFGVMGFAMMSMPTLRDAFHYWTRYSLLSGPPLLSTISEDGDQWGMHFTPRRAMSAEGLRFCIEVNIAAIVPVIQELSELPPNTTRVDFCFNRPGEADRYDLFATNDIRFNHTPSTYYGLRSDLDRPLRSHDEDVGEMFRRRCDKALADLRVERSVREQLEDRMLACAGRMPSLDEMADTLGMSSRSLQRELGDQGLNYQQVVKEFRMRHAKVLLNEGRTNIKMIAYLLGFKDVNSFRRAFHGWTGVSVGQWQTGVSARSSADATQVRG
jgi:AraC-like DNA-binding protein